MPKLEFWYEFSSTYSYLSAMRIEALCQSAGVELIWRPFLLGPIFQSQGWATSPFNIYEAKGRYMWRDMDRRAAAQGLPPIIQPDPFPQNGLAAARVAIIGTDDGWAPEFTRAVYDAQFAKGHDIGDPQRLSTLLVTLGLDGPALLRHAQTDLSVKTRLHQTTDKAKTLGLFGAPSFLTEDGELFWGDDRLEDAINWA